MRFQLEGLLYTYTYT